MARKINTEEDVTKAEFKEQIHKCGRHIFLSLMADYDDIKVYQITFEKSYDINYDRISNSEKVDFTHCPYCGKSLIEYE